jgi:hypothetical protein
VDNELTHWGIFGMKWGRRRFQNPDGTLTPEGRERYGVGAARDAGKQPETKKPPKKASEMNDQELKSRIDRLNLEKTYAQLISEANERKRGPVSKAISKALTNLGDRVMGLAVDKVVDRLKNGEKFDIDDWKYADVDTMDSDTISKVQKWWAAASSINKARKSAGKTQGAQHSAEGEDSSSSQEYWDEWIRRNNRPVSTMSLPGSKGR